MTATRIARAIAVAGALCAVLALRVFVTFEPFRIKVVEQPIPSVEGTVRLPANRLGGFDRLQGPFAVIARIRHLSPDPEPFDIEIDGRIACTVRVRPGAARRVDCAWPHQWSPGAEHRVSIAGRPRDWTLEYLEVGTHHGATRAYDLLIVPAISSHYGPPGPFWIGTAFVVLTLVFALPVAGLPRPVRIGWTVLAAAVGLIFVLVFLSPLVSPFLVLLSATAFVRGVAVLAAPRLWLAGSAAVRRFSSRRRWPAAAAALAAVLVAAAYGRVVSERLDTVYDGNYSGFLQISRNTADPNPMLGADVRRTLRITDGGGYDGQFMYYIAFDPFLRRYHDDPAVYRTFVDAPPYRYGRIGFSLLIRALSGNRWQLYPATMVWLVLAALAACALLMAAIARLHGESPWWGAVVLAIPGFWQSLQVALPEPVAAALLLGGYVCTVRGRWIAAGALFALALLTRETALVFVVCACGGAFTAGRRRQALMLAAGSVLPLVAWRLYVAAVLWPDWGFRGLAYSPQGTDLPLAGIVELWAAVAGGEYFAGNPDMARAAIWFPLLLVAGSGLALASAVVTHGALSVAAVFYAVLALCLNVEAIWVHVANAQRATFELFITLAIVTVAAGARHHALHRSLLFFWAAAAAYVFIGGFDAEYLRRTVLWPFF